MKMYEILAHLYLDFSRYFRSASLRVLERREESGDSLAGYLAGEVHALVGQEKDALACFERAAEQGVVEAQIALANHYEEENQQTDAARARAIHFLQLAGDNPSLGVRFPHNPTMRAYLFGRRDRLKKAINPNCLIYVDSVRVEVTERAAQGDPEANHQMGMFHYLGRPQEFGYIAGGGEGAATPFWTAAAKQGHVGSQLLLAYFGSETWLRSAAKDGNRGAQRELAQLLYQQAAESWRERARGARDRTKPFSTDPSLLNEAISCWKAAATKGCGESSAWLAAIFGAGDWVNQDLVEAFTWCRHEAATGGTNGVTLANCYYTGVGTQRNTADALRWYVAAALSGKVDAMLSLGHIYAKGQDVARDLAEAARWFDRAVEKRRQEITADIRRDYQPEFPAEIYAGMQCSFICREALNGSFAALKIIESFYQDELPYEQTFNGLPIFILSEFNSSFYFLKVHESLRDSLTKWASSGIQAAQVVLGESSFDDGFDKDAVSRRLHYMKLAAEQGNTYALHLLGDMGHHPCDDGGVRPGEDPAAADWYRRAAALGDLEAKFKMACLGEYAIFDNGPTDWPAYDQADLIEDSPEFQQVVGLYREVAEMEHPRAQMRLAAMLDGSSIAFARRRTRLKECKATQREAVHWLRKSAENGYASAAYRLAKSLDAGRNAWTPRSPEVIHWYRAAARGSDNDACRELQHAYLIGDGVPQDGAEAMYWQRSAQV